MQKMVYENIHILFPYRWVPIMSASNFMNIKFLIAVNNVDELTNEYDNMLWYFSLPICSSEHVYTIRY